MYFTTMRIVISVNIRPCSCRNLCSKVACGYKYINVLSSKIHPNIVMHLFLVLTKLKHTSKNSNFSSNSSVKNIKRCLH